jgi:hypothetical protein
VREEVIIAQPKAPTNGEIVRLMESIQKDLST